MANEKKYTPEVERLLLAARGLYDAASRAQLTAGLAAALRDGVAFDKLQNDEILALSRFVRELEKMERPPLEQPAEQPAASSSGEATAAPASKPDDKKPKASKGGKGADSTP